MAVRHLALFLVLAAAAASGGPAPAAPSTLAEATFAGGCFWCMEPPFDAIPGVVSTTSGYTGGTEVRPTYEQVSAGATGHRESVQVVYDPSRVSYETLLDAFWHNIDPTDPGGQFVDRGSQYRSAVFYHSEDQRRAAEASRGRLEASGRFPKPIVTEILPAGAFYAAEEYHQDYYRKNPLRYRFYRYGSGRDPYLDKVWGPDRPYSGH